MAVSSNGGGAVGNESGLVETGRPVLLGAVPRTRSFCSPLPVGARSQLTVVPLTGDADVGPASREVPC